MVCTFVSKFVVVACLLVLAIPALPVAAQENPAPLLQECAEVDEASLQDELHTLTQGVFATAVADIDLETIVRNQWDELGMDAVVRAEVDRAVAHVKQDTDFWNSFLSGWSPAKGQELTEAVADEAFDSEGFRQAIETLSAGVAVAISTGIGDLQADGVSRALYCLQTFIRANYSEAVLNTFEQEMQVAASTVQVEGPGINPGTVIGQHTTALGGVGVIVAAQVAKSLTKKLISRLSTRVAGRVTTRLLGRVGTQLIPLAGWVVGIGLIAWDIYDSRDGAIPAIQESLRAEEVMTFIQGQIVAAVEPELRLAVPEVATEIADDLYSQWLEIKRDLRVILELAKSDAAYGGLLASMQTPEQLARLVAVTAALLGSAGAEAVKAAAADGSLQRAVELSADVTPVVLTSGSLADALAWSEAAGAMLDDVVRLEIHKARKPGDLGREQLRALIDVESPAAVSELALLPTEQLVTLLGLSSQSLRDLAKAFDGEQLVWIARTLEELPTGERGPLVSRLLSDPRLIDALQDTGVTEIVPPGSNLDEVIGFLGGPRDGIAIATDALAVVTGEPTAQMYQHKYGWPTTLMVLAIALLIALILLRLIWSMGLWVLEPVLALGSIGRRRTRQSTSSDAGALLDTLDESRREVERLRRENDSLRADSGSTVAYGGQKKAGYAVQTQSGQSASPEPSPDSGADAANDASSAER